MKRRLSILVNFLLAAICLWLGLEYATSKRVHIGGTAMVTETNSGMVFEALVDTGAGRCSINCIDLEIKDEAELPENNIGKSARILIANERGEQAWIESQLIDFSNIRNVDTSTPRYHVNLKLSCQGIDRKVSVTLKDRSHMTFPLLLGRNFLQDKFVVDVAKENADFPKAK